MYTVTLILFLLPSALLWRAWKHSAPKRAGQGPSLGWRGLCGKAALILAVCSTLLELVFFFSWFHNGGSPHGMMPSPGIWKVVGRISGATLIASLVLSAFGKGKWRLLIPGWAASYALVVYLIFALEMD
jgi:hypothetical protein